MKGKLHVAKSLRLPLTPIQTKHHSSFLTSRMDPRRRYGGHASRLHATGSHELAQTGYFAHHIAGYSKAISRSHGPSDRFLCGYRRWCINSVDGSQMEERREKTFLHEGLWQGLRSRDCTIGIPHSGSCDNGP